jgi:hypothetical protein
MQADYAVLVGSIANNDRTGSIFASSVGDAGRIHGQSVALGHRACGTRGTPLSGKLLTRTWEGVYFDIREKWTSTPARRTQMNNDVRFDPAGVLSLSDIVRFQYFHLMRKAWPAALVIALMLLACIVGTCLILLAGDLSRLVNPGLFLVIFSLGACLLGASPYWSARKQFSTQKFLQKPMRFTFGLDRVRLEAPDFAGELSWPIVHRVDETNSLFLIYHNPHIAWILPKRFFWGEEQLIQQWRDFAAKQLGKPHRLHRHDVLGKWL